jgi:iron complex transport system substrate-binding protein
MKYIRGLILAVIGIFLVSPAPAAPPERIVSLAPSVTEILYDLGLEGNIVGVTNYCDEPPRARTKPRIGGYDSPSLEAIVAARPDLVIMTKEKNPGHIRERLGKLGIRTYVFSARRLSELPAAVRELGRILDVAEIAEKKAGAIEKGVAQFTRTARSRARAAVKPRVLFIIHPEPLVVAGPGTLIDEALGRLGLQNVAAKSSVQYPKFSIEEVIRLNPDIIFIGIGYMTTGSAQGVLKKLSMLDAVRKGKVYPVSESLYRLGPRVVAGMEELAGHVYSR